VRMRVKMSHPLLASVVVMAAAACASGHATTTASTTAPRPIAAPATTTTLDPVRDAAAAYLAIADSLNQRARQIRATYSGPTGVLDAQAAPMCTESAALEREWANRLSQRTWPDQAGGAVATLRAANLALAHAYDACATAPNPTSAGVALQAASGAPATAVLDAGQHVRAVLGLPPATS